MLYALHCGRLASRFKPDRTAHLDRFTHVKRGPSPLSAGQRELIAAFTSCLNEYPHGGWTEGCYPTYISAL